MAAPGSTLLARLAHTDPLATRSMIVPPSFELWIDAVHTRCVTTASSPLHGDRHWRCVAAVGQRLLEAGEPADPAVVFAFALLHDSQRQNDGGDPGHGARAATFAQRLHDDRILELSPTQLELLKHACRHHTGGQPTREPTIAVCWDSDRLNLIRVGQTVDPSHISTLSALDESATAFTLKVQANVPTWHALIEA